MSNFPIPDSDLEPISQSAGDAAERLQRLWGQGQQPDVDEFLVQAGALTPAQMAAVLRIDQRQRWQAGQPVPAESYLERHPEIQAEPEAVLDLIFNEFLLRERLQETPALAEFLKRFPEYAATLQQQIELHRALADHTEDGAATVHQSPPDRTETGAIQPAAAGARMGPDSRTLPGVGTPAQLPANFGRYRLHRLLGEGGMGAVYQAHDTVLDRPVALKVIRFPGREADQTIQRFYREARAAAGFSHPHLCPVYDVGEHGGIHYLVMPLLPGQSLAAWVRTAGPLPEATAARVAAQAARALQAAHEAGVLHRDLKPSNIMLNERQEPVVIDFGLAWRGSADAEARLTPAGGVLGTPAYLAPEQIIEAAATASPRTDVYSLGAVLYEMLTGRAPFQGALYEVLRKVVEQTPEPLARLRPGLAPRLEAICRKAMSKNPAARYESMAALAADLEGFLQEGPSSTSSGPKLLVSQKRQLRLGALAALVLAGVLLVMLLLWLRSLGQEEEQPSAEGPPPGQKPATPAKKSVSVTNPAPGLLPGSPAGVLGKPGLLDGPQPLPGNKAAAAELLKIGSRWEGQFRFRDMADYSGDLKLEITKRSGNKFQGVYTSEQGKYIWLIAGEIDGPKVKWEFTKAIKDNKEKNVVGRAQVEGTFQGETLVGTFSQRGLAEVADVKFKRQK